MNALNKIVGFVANPLFVGMIIVLAGLILTIMRRRKGVIWLSAISLAWFWFWSMPIVGKWLALPLEEDYPVMLAEDMPEADAIVLMGGGAWGSTNYPYACLSEGADRAWHAARLWKAGKSSIIIPSCVDAIYGDVRVLLDLGVPAEAIELENNAKNTEQNAKFVARILNGEGVKGGAVEELQRTNSKPTHSPTRILLVTSACHMRRSLYMFEKYAPEIECIPAATDYQALPGKDSPFDIRGLLPNIDAFVRNNSFIHEYIGYYGYKWFR